MRREWVRVSKPDDPTELISVQVDQFADRTVAFLVGELDMSNAAEVLRRLTEVAIGCPRLEVDLSRLGFIDSAGITGLYRLHRSLEQEPGDRLRILAAPDSVAGRTLRLAGMDRVLPMQPPDGSAEP